MTTTYVQIMLFASFVASLCVCFVTVIDTYTVWSALKLYKLKSDWLRNGNSTLPRVCMRNKPK